MRISRLSAQAGFNLMVTTTSSFSGNVGRARLLRSRRLSHSVPKTKAFRAAVISQADRFSSLPEVLLISPFQKYLSAGVS